LAADAQRPTIPVLNSLAGKAGDDASVADSNGFQSVNANISTQLAEVRTILVDKGGAHLVNNTTT
jgi:hypothetical protein